MKFNSLSSIEINKWIHKIHLCTWYRFFQVRQDYRFFHKDAKGKRGGFGVETPTLKDIH